ncbi:MAG: hypothetical protein U0840_17440 [Gemmataceae bacterium]
MISRSPLLRPRRSPRKLTLEALEHRLAPATLTNLQFQIPAHVAEMGVQIGLYGQVPPASGPTTQYQYLDSTFNYQLVPTSGSLPLITLTNAGGTYNQTQSVSVPLPDTAINSGAVVMFIGPNSGIIINAPSGTYTTGTVATPTVNTNPNDIFGLFELNFTSNSLDVDISEVDQVGFTYTVSFDPSTSAPYPLSQVGSPVDRSTFFQRYKDTFSTTNTEFLAALTLGDGKRLLAPQTLLGNIKPPAAPGAAPDASITGSLDPSRYYYYLLTEYTATGETPASPTIFGGYLNPPGQTGLTAIQVILPSKPTNQQTIGYNIYRVDVAGNGFNGTITPFPTTGFGLLQQVPLTSIPSNFQILDNGSITPNTGKTPPTSAYGFDPLSTYFTPPLQQFFAHYAQSSGNVFVYNQAPMVGTVGTTWKGSVVTYNGYSVLQLTGQAGGEFANAVVNIYSPFFASNTNNASLPAMPSWMASAIGNNTESPSQMVFGCDGVFNTGTVDPDITNQVGTYPSLDKATNEIENQIVSAFNRGLATSYNFALAPNQWVAPFQFTANPAPSSVTGGSLTPGATYYYLMTSVYTDSLGIQHETVTTREVMATLGSSDNAVTLNWGPLPLSTVSTYKIYRGTAPGKEVLVGTVTNTASDPPSQFVDGTQTSSSTGAAPPYRFYSAGSTSNLYSAFLHQNITTNPTTGISINGLVYGYPFDDQGSFSTNVQFPSGVFPTTVHININPFAPEKQLSVSAPASDTAGTQFMVTVKAETGTTIHFTASDSKATLPANYTFVTGDNGTKQFPITLLTAGKQTLTITDTTSGRTASAQVQITPGVTAGLAFRQQPVSTLVGNRLDVSVEARDAYDNLVPTATGAITLRGAGLPANTRAILREGIARFSVLLRTPGQFAFQALSSLGDALSSRFDVSNAVRLRVTAPPTVHAGQAFQVVVSARRADGVIDPNFTGPITLYRGSTPIASGTATNGVATLQVTLQRAGETTLVARSQTSPSLRGVHIVRVLPAAVSSFRFVGLPTHVRADTFYALNLLAVDAFGNRVPSYRGVVALSSSDPLATLPAQVLFSSRDAGRHPLRVRFGTIGTQSLLASAASDHLTGQATNIQVARLDASLTGPGDGVPAQPLAFVFNATVGTVAPSTRFRYSITWGDGSAPQILWAGASLNLSHGFLVPGNHTVRVTITDALGNTDQASQPVAIVPFRLAADPAHPGNLSLFVGGTPGDDTILVTPTNLAGTSVEITRNGTSLGTFSPTGRIYVYGGAGNDSLRVEQRDVSGTPTAVAVSAMLFAGAGNDTIDARGSSAANVLSGDAGNDRLLGGAGRDLLQGGLGADRLEAGLGGSLLLGGQVNFSAPIPALDSVLAEWQLDRNYRSRVNALRGIESGLNAPWFLLPATVQKDLAVDQLVGNTGRDWFFLSVSGIVDLLLGYSLGEEVTLL